MRKELEYAKKITLIAKLYRMNLLSEKEFEKIRRKLMDSYLVSGERSDDPVKHSLDYDIERRGKK